MQPNGPDQPASSPPPGPQNPGPLLRTAGDYAWRLLAVGTVGYFLVQLLSKLDLVVIPFLAAILVTGLLQPVANRLRRMGMSRGPATLITMLGAIFLLGGLMTEVVVRATQQAPQLGNEINRLLPHVRHWLIHGPLQINAKTVDNLNNTVTNDITKNSSKIASAALSTGKTVLSFLTGLLLAIFSVIFLVYDGDRV